MGYDYTTQRNFVFTEEGVRKLFAIRDKVSELLATAGAFREDFAHVSGDSWDTLACIDYLVERGEIVRVSDEHRARQHYVYVKG